MIPPQKAKSVPSEYIIDSRAIWAKRGDQKSYETSLKGKWETLHDFDVKCRIVGKGFQERYDERVRRDSPTSSSFMHNVLCSVSASEQLTMVIGDARGAFLQGKRITRQLYL